MIFTCINTPVLYKKIDVSKLLVRDLELVFRQVTVNRAALKG